MSIGKPWYRNPSRAEPQETEYNEMVDEFAADEKQDEAANVVYLWQAFPDQMQEHPEWIDE